MLQKPRTVINLHFLHSFWSKLSVVILATLFQFYAFEYLCGWACGFLNDWESTHKLTWKCFIQTFEYLQNAFNLLYSRWWILFWVSNTPNSLFSNQMYDQTYKRNDKRRRKKRNWIKSFKIYIRLPEKEKSGIESYFNFFNQNTQTRLGEYLPEEQT